eukprot:10615433-Prorocentrum_lima.AAC.1
MDVSSAGLQQTPAHVADPRRADARMPQARGFHDIPLGGYPGPGRTANTAGWRDAPCRGLQ